jgi:hypothetical protein
MNTCEFCNKSFKSERTIMVHVCEQKRRFMAQHERHVILAFETFNRFHKLSLNAQIDKTYEEFCHSRYYNSFVKFGSFVNNVNPLYPYQFIDYIIKKNVKLHLWCNEGLYDKYVLDLVRSEPVEVALERTIIHMMDWGTKNNDEWNHYFNNASLNKAAYDVKDGKVSPWLILNSNKGKLMLKKFDDDQLNTINSILNIPFWLRKFKRYPQDVELVKNIVKEAEL